MDHPYVAIDPGLTSGWATFNEAGDVTDKGTIKQKDLVKILPTLITVATKVVIVEDYKNHGWMNQPKWQRNDTSEIIGKIEMLCEMLGVRMERQPNTIKPIGYKWANITPPKNHDLSHDMDAYVHGVYWLQQNGVRPIGRAIPKDKR